MAYDLFTVSKVISLFTCAEEVSPLSSCFRLSSFILFFSLFHFCVQGFQATADFTSHHSSVSRAKSRSITGKRNDRVTISCAAAGPFILCFTFVLQQHTVLLLVLVCMCEGGLSPYETIALSCSNDHIILRHRTADGFPLVRILSWFQDKDKKIAAMDFRSCQESWQKQLQKKEEEKYKGKGRQPGDRNACREWNQQKG